MLYSHDRYHVIIGVFIQQQETRLTGTRKAFSHQSSFHGNCFKAWSMVRKVWGLVCQNDSPSLTACPQALYRTEEHEELATNQKLNAESLL